MLITTRVELYKQLEVARKRISELEEQPEGQKQQLLLIGNVAFLCLVDVKMKILTPISPPNSVETAKPSSPYSGGTLSTLG